MIKDVIIHEMATGIRGHQNPKGQGGRDEKSIMTGELIPFRGPRDLAAVKMIPPALFLAGPRAGGGD
jgi:hypothetical protein